ncbi:M23 family metallopeptidase [candidate division KSB1 bacterium]|nr:M23 family metallopeptidase [candidate division KSB1 bacterium]
MAKNKLKKKKQFISFLIIADNQSEPLGFKLRVVTLRILGGIAVLLLLSVIAGAVFFVKYLQVNNENVALKVENSKLERENSRVALIAGKFEELKIFSSKLKISLGIEEAQEFDEGIVGASISNETNISFNNGSKNKNDQKVSARNFENILRRVGSITTSYHMMYERLPTLLPVEGLISLGFDDINLAEPQIRDKHFGIDIVAKRGSVIKASGEGTIVFADWTPDLGNLIIIYHGSDIFTFYAHNMRLLRTVGMVRKGDPIALLGNSGETSSGPHLHFEIWRDSKPVDPKEYLFSLQTDQQQEL